ncbi:hypothetical protein ACP70R_021773 [Stipagrostis hirtigluma subsp. patula]
MEDKVASALVQEGVSRVSSYISSKIQEKATRVQIVSRLEMAVSKLELALERSGKLPITDVALLRRMKIIKHAYIEGKDLLNKHKLQLVEGQQEIEQVVTASSFLERVTRAANLPPSISSLLGLNKEKHLSSSVVQIFEWFADSAGQFVAAVVSGCSLRHHMFCNPVTRHLLEGKTIRYQMEQGSISRSFYIWPVLLEERGVMAWLQYKYQDKDIRDEDYSVDVVARLSESIDIFGIAMKSLEPLASQFKLVTESARKELTMLANSQDICHLYAAVPFALQEKLTKNALFLLPDPVCCTANGHEPCANNTVSSDLPHLFPVEVVSVLFQCVSVQESTLGSSSDEAFTSDTRVLRLSLELSVAIVPRALFEGVQEDVISDLVSNEHTAGSMQQMAEMVRSKGMECLVRDIFMTEYNAMWASRHGGAYFTVKKPLHTVLDLASDLD